MRPRTRAVERVLSARLSRPHNQDDANGQIGAVTDRFAAASPPAPVRVEQLRQHLGATPTVALAPRDDLGELNGSSDRDMLQDGDAWQPAADGFDDQRGERLTWDRDRDRADLTVSTSVPTQPEQPGNGVAVVSDASGKHNAQGDDGQIVEHRCSGFGVDQVQAKPETSAERLKGRRPEVTSSQRQPQQIVELSHVAELLRPVLVVRLGDGAHDVAEADRVRDCKQWQLELTSALS